MKDNFPTRVMKALPGTVEELSERTGLTVKQTERALKYLVDYCGLAEKATIYRKDPRLLDNERWRKAGKAMREKMGGGP